MRRLVRSRSLVLMGLVGVLSGCSSSGNDNSGLRDGGGNGASNNGDGSLGGGGGVVIIGSGGTTSGSKGGTAGTAGAGQGASAGTTAGGPITKVTEIDGGAACVSDKVEAKDQVLDIFIMQDRSGSMKDATSSGGSKWTVITNALSTFVNDPKSAGIGAGIGFFSITVPGDGGDTMSCNASDYAKPAVGIAPLNGNAKAIVAAISKLSPAGNTPTEPALQGAIDYAEAWAKKNPTHKVIVVFATDGLPNGCNSTVPGAAAIAAKGLATAPSIPTYVVGVFGTKDCKNGLNQQCNVVDNTNAIAKAGGTGSAFIVDTGGNTETEFVDAMNTIRTANSVSCDFTIPPAPSGKAIDPTRATVQYRSGTKAPVDLTWSATVAACNAKTGGWYYDSVTKPDVIHLCAETCTAVKADPAAHIEVLLACEVPGTHPPGTGNGGASGSGGAGGKGGTSGAGGAKPGTGGTASCLLNGQSCLTSSECCVGTCSVGVCSQVR